MKPNLLTKIGSLELKNPIIAASAEHMIHEGGLRAAIETGVGAVVVKSYNESDAAREQLRAAEYLALDANWEPVEWGPDTDPAALVLTRSGLTPLAFDAWLELCLTADRIARQNDCLLVASIILSNLDTAVETAKKIEAAGIRALEFNIGTPYASEAARGAVATETSATRVAALSKAMTEAVSIPVWIRITGQSEDVPDLAGAAFNSGATSVVMAGRLLGLIPDLETQAPYMSTSAGYGGYWNLPLTCHWLAHTRTRLGSELPLIGTNGATSGRDVARMMLAGASAVGMTSAVMMRGFGVLEDALQVLTDYLAEKNMSAADLVGRAADQRKRFTDMPDIGDNWKRYVPPESR